MQGAREYTRALTAAKLERLHAKPFVGSLEGHRDGVYCMARHQGDLKMFISGSADGEVRLWNLATRQCTWSRQAHQAFIKGVAFLPHYGHDQQQQFLTAASDKFVKIWDSSETKAKAIFEGEAPFTGIDVHRQGRLFATSGATVDIWDVERAEPIQTFSWGADTITAVKWNQAETSILASCATDRSIMLHDMRMKSSLSKVILSMSSNALSWNPMEAFYFTVANEDFNAYVFDMRYLEKAVNVFKGHSGAVIDVDYSPTGQQVATASYDKSMRLFDVRAGSSRDIYHTRRMQRLFSIRFSLDSSYLLSGSDDGSLRIWKTQASAKLGVSNPREAAALHYADALKEKFKAMPEVQRISNHRLLPKHIKSASRIAQIQRESVKRKEANRRKHSKQGTVPHSNIREDVVVTIKK